MKAMAKRLRNHVLFALFLVIILLFTTATLLAQIEARSGRTVDAAGVYADLAFFAGRDVTLDAKSTDDIIAAGGDVSMNAVEADDLIAAGGDVAFDGVRAADLMAAAMNLNFISGEVGDDVIAAGGDINIREDFKIGGSVVLAGGEVRIDAPIPGELRATGARIRLDANVDGDVHLVSEETMIGPNVEIGGDLRHRVRRLTIDPGAVIAGDVIELEPADPPDFEKWGARVAGAAALFAVAFLVGAALLVVLIAVFLPGLMNSAAAMIAGKPFVTLGVGFLILVAAPAAITLLFASILGIPLAMVIAAVYVAAAPLAIAAFVYFVGIQARALVGQSAESPTAGARAIWSALASGAFVVVGLVPIIGGVVWLFAYVFGLGAVITRGGKALARHA